MDYKHCFMSHRQQPTQQSLSNYIDSHNAYVQQLHTTNAMLEAYHLETIPQLMQELEEVYADLCSIVSDSIFNGASVILEKVCIKIITSLSLLFYHLSSFGYDLNLEILLLFRIMRF